MVVPIAVIFRIGCLERFLQFSVCATSEFFGFSLRRDSGYTNQSFIFFTSKQLKESRFDSPKRAALYLSKLVFGVFMLLR